MADFTKETNFSERQQFSKIKFGANVPLLEVELNEMQDIQNYKRKLALQNIMANGFINKHTMTCSSGTLTVPADTIVVDGEFIEFTENMTLSVTAGDIVYLQVHEVEVTYLSTLKQDGNQSAATTISNTLYDARVDRETTRRYQYQLSLVKTVPSPPDEGYVYLDIASITGASTFTDTRTKSEVGDALTQITQHIDDTTVSTDESYTIGTDFATLQEAFDAFNSKTISQDASVTFILPALIALSSPVTVTHPNADKMFIQGQTTTAKVISSLGTVTGSTGNWSCPITAVNVSGAIATGDMVIITGTTGTGTHTVHRGIWEVLNVNGNVITVKNTYVGATFPVSTLTGGTIDKINSVIECTNCSALVITNCSLGGLRDVAIVGDSSGGHYGLRLADGAVNIQDNVGVTGFIGISSGGVRATLGSKVSGAYLMLCGNTVGARLEDGSNLSLTSSIIEGNTTNYTNDASSFAKLDSILKTRNTIMYDEVLGVNFILGVENGLLYYEEV